MKRYGRMHRVISVMLAVVMIMGLVPPGAVRVHAVEESGGAAQWDTDRLYNAIPVASGQLMPEDCSVAENDIYGYVVNYPLKKGHVLSISNTDYVFSVRKLVDGNYSTMLKQATIDSFTATEDMVVGMLIRKPDKSALTADELASIVIYDSQYGMIGVEGSVKRFTVEAETIDGGTAATRAAIFLPGSYSETGTPTKLIVMTNGGSAYLTESSWQGNTEANRNLVEFYLQNGYAVLINDNTAGKVVNNTSGMVPDLGCLQQLSGLMKSYEYVCNALNLERKFSIHARSQGTFVGIRIMREFPELVKCALITGPNVSAEHRWTVIANKDHTAKRFGFSDLTGSTFEADKFVGNDIYTDMAAEDYSLLPTFWMESNNDVCPNNNKSIYEVVERLRELGCTAEYQKFSDLTHSETCRLASEEATVAALAFLEKYQESHTHSYTSTVTAPTCTEQGYTTYTCECGESYVADFVDATGHSYENGVCTGCGEEYPGAAIWRGKSAVFVGDSITAGTGTTKIYYEYLEETFGFGSVTAMGVPGSCISAASDYGQSTKPLIGRYQNIPSADLIVVFMGTNDYGHETPLGSVEDTQDGTFYGAVNTIVSALVEKHTSSKIVFVTPLHRYGFGTSKILGTKFTYDHIPNGVGATLADYADAIQTVCANYGVPVIDLHTECTLDPTDSADRDAYIPDGLHPNAAGHEIIAGIMGNHIRDMEPAEKTPEEETELVYGNRFATGFEQQNRASSRVNRYLKAGTVITLKDTATFQWACAKTDGENSSNNLGYFPDSAWSDKETAVVVADGWVGFTFKYRDETKVFDLSKPLSDYITIEEPHTHTYENGICTGCGEKVPEPQWEIGTIAYATGLNRDNTNRLRTTEYLKLSDYGMVDVATGYELVRFVYDQNYKLLSATDWLGSGVGVSMTELQTQYPQGVYFRVAMRATDDRELTLDDLQTAGVTFYAPGEEPEKPLWEQGTIASANGQNNTAANRFRTADYHRLSDFAGVDINDGYTMTNFVYDENYTYLGTSSWLGDGVPFRTADLLKKYPTGVYFRVAFCAADGRKLTEDDVAASGVKFCLPGEEISFGFEFENVANIGSWQDGAIWEGKLFALGASGTGAVFDVETGERLSSLTLDGKDVLVPHANSVCFGSTYYAEGDQYPLLYVNIYNNYASAEDRMEGTCCVYRITEADGAYTTELVQVIRIGFTEDLTLWKSKENNGDVRPYGNFVVDTDNRQFYAFVMRDANKTTRYFRFDIPGLGEGVYNDSYGCNVVTLEPADIKAQFDSEYYNYLQGCCYSSGMILYVGDFGGVAPLYLVDLESQKVSDIFYLGAAGLRAEPEVLCVDPDSGKLYYAAADGVLRIITLDDVHFHTYTATVTAPTCTEQGYTTYTCTACGDSYVDDFVDATGHTYENGICTGCGEEHPNRANYEGKVISILGDSISTFAGYIPVADGFNLAHKTRYPQDNLLTDVNETWWMQIINNLDAKLGINDSWASSEVYNYIDEEVNSTSDGTKACMASVTRIQNLGSNGTPDVILFFGGTNDITQSRPLGTFDPATAPTEVDLTSVKWDTVADAYVDAIMRMQYYYPDAQIVAMLPYYRSSQGTAKVDKYNNLFASICEHYGVAYVDLRYCGITGANIPDGTHPDADGMDYITDAVMELLASDCNVTAGEHIVHSVTHNLNGAKSTLGYYKGISHGKSFTTTITGDDFTVTVTMGGVDITADCYANGVISIDCVTGDLVIIAEGRPKTVYADYLQKLPTDLCGGTNLWTALKPINLYYRSSGWGLNATGLAHSITFNVSAGDQIWATSFQESGLNGGTKNGIALTWFDTEGLIETFTPEKTYAEFAKNGYLTAPKGAVAVNVVMWNGNENYEVYILNRDHTYENGTCTICGAKESVSYTPGDITGDGVVDNKDVTRLFKYLSNYDVEVVEAALDVNGDGEISNKDVTRLFRYLSGYDVTIH